jgi:hypothetical protein
VAASSGRSCGGGGESGCGRGVRAGRKAQHEGGGIRPVVGGSALLKGASGARAKGGSSALDDVWGGAGVRERRPGDGRDSARGTDTCD